MARVSIQKKLRKANQDVWDVTEERDAGKARLLNFSTGHKVEMIWGMNEDSTRDQMFIMRIGDNEAILNAEEVQRFLRWI